MRDTLFLLEPDFTDGTGRFFCPGSALVEGMLSFYPELREHVEVRYLPFARPRQEVLERIGEDNQGCPVLVLHADSPLPEGIGHGVAGTTRFINDERAICEYLAVRFGTGRPH
jgi:hypothetical protein